MQVSPAFRKNSNLTRFEKFWANSLWKPMVRRMDMKPYQIITLITIRSLFEKKISPPTAWIFYFILFLFFVSLVTKTKTIEEESFLNLVQLINPFFLSYFLKYEHKSNNLNSSKVSLHNEFFFIIIRKTNTKNCSKLVLFLK